jgi:hypothetical protein
MTWRFAQFFWMNESSQGRSGVILLLLPVERRHQSKLSATMSSPLSAIRYQQGLTSLPEAERSCESG